MWILICLCRFFSELACDFHMSQTVFICVLPISQAIFLSFFPVILVLGVMLITRTLWHELCMCRISIEYCFPSSPKDPLCEVSKTTLSTYMRYPIRLSILTRKVALKLCTQCAKNLGSLIYWSRFTASVYVTRLLDEYFESPSNLFLPSTCESQVYIYQVYWNHCVAPWTTFKELSRLEIPFALLTEYLSYHPKI